jgi:DNA mismatch endonuclease (patch repair protein)
MKGEIEVGVRAQLMSRIRKVNTKPEMVVRKFLFKEGFRYRLHDRKLPGSPDIVFRKLKTVIFVNGCFWHGHDGCKYNKYPKSNQSYWIPKILKTKERDKINSVLYRKMGWRMIVIWECDLQKTKVLTTFESLIITMKGIVTACLKR